MEPNVIIALAGNPNAGKTTLFNHLTGARQHVGNYPGVTVEKKEGSYTLNSQRLRIVDLPGTYSMTAYSVEEVVARDYLVTEKPQVIVNITDASNLERNLYLTCQFLEMGVPLVLALNMVDVARERGIDINAARLSELLRVPVIPIVARSGEGTRELMESAVVVANEERQWQPVPISYGDDLDETLLVMEGRIAKANFLSDTYPSRWVAIKYLEGDEQIISKGRQEDPALHSELDTLVRTVTDHLRMTMDTYPEAMIADHRYGFIKAILRQDIVTRSYDTDRLYMSDRIDKVLTNRLLGPVIMCCVLLGLYHFTFTYSELPVNWLGSFFEWISGVVDTMLPDGPLKSLLVSGVIDGVGGVLGFVPMIMFMFFGIAILEDSGYLARVAFMMDRIFRTFGLHGSSVMSYIVSGGIAGGCAVPGVMATRTLRSPNERMATMLTTPFMNCGAKLPVLALLIGTFFGAYEAAFMFALTLLAWAMALIAAKILRMTVLRGESTPFVMELPPYRFPTFKGLLIHTWEKTWQYIKKAGTVILGISILLWALMSYPVLPEDARQVFVEERAALALEYPAENPAAIENLEPDDEMLPLDREFAGRLLEIDAREAGASLRYSIAGQIGTALEKVSWLAGFDWRTNIALVGGFAAKEVVISTLGTAYSLGAVDPEQTSSLAQTLATDSAWNPVMALALIVFIMFYSPCFVTVVCIVRESGSWKWGLFSMAFNTVFAFTLAVLVFQIGTALVG